MHLYVLDTDHLSLYGRGHQKLCERLTAFTKNQLATTAINLEEQLRDRLSQISEAKGDSELVYQRLTETVMMLSEFHILGYSQEAQTIYREFKTQRLRVGTQDLRIAAIVLAYNRILLTRNTRDFDKIPQLRTEDWSI